MELINPERFHNLVTEAWRADFSGWDFHWLEGRLVEDPLPWDYPRLVHDHFPGVNSMLDMGTGGGELLASLAPLPPETHVTESYPPNQVIAKVQADASRRSGPQSWKKALPCLFRRTFSTWRSTAMKTSIPQKFSAFCGPAAYSSPSRSAAWTTLNLTRYWKTG